MENNSNSALKINQVIAVLTILVILGTSVQLFNMKGTKAQIAKINIQEEVKENIKVAKSYERTVKVTSRSEINRTAKVESNIQENKNEELVSSSELTRTQKVTSRSEANRTEKENKIPQAVRKYKKIEEITISTNMDLSVRCGISKDDFNKLMSNLRVDTSGFFKRNSNTIYELCEKYEINEIFFCGLIAAESGWNIASSHRKANNYISMMSKGKLIKYSSEEAGLEAAAKLLHSRYLTKGGSCYSGKTLSAVQKRFCPNSNTWVGLVFGCMKQVLK